MSKRRFFQSIAATLFVFFFVVSCSSSKKLQLVEPAAGRSLESYRAVAQDAMIGTPNPQASKIGLEILVKGNIRTYGEVGYVFQDRAAGESKLDARQYVDYIRHLARLYMYKLKSV